MLAIIPARGGSKRLKRKNVLGFNGKPMIAWTIEAALASGRFHKIVVSTDDEEIASVAEKYWVCIDRRPEHLATDSARVVDVCVDVLSRHETESTACLYATSPMRTADDIQRTAALLSGDCHFALAATDYALSPHQALRLVGDDAEPMWPNLIEMRHDEMPRFVVDNGSTYVCHVRHFLEQRTFYGAPLRVHVMPRERSVDIDTQTDLDMAKWFSER